MIKGLLIAVTMLKNASTLNNSSRINNKIKSVLELVADVQSTEYQLELI
jgi:hypothetical protein